ncbi:chemotaxis protein CheV [candidate division KSB1 bacterium]|nr:chemotaxis protein CheV [candidate division KSB1 bacterium]
MSTMKEPEAYLASGSNELKILEYMIGDLHLGINILKVSRVLVHPEKLARPGSGIHSSVVGMFEDHGNLVPMVDLAEFLGLKKSEQNGRVIITEFYNEINGFLVDSVDRVHTISWKQVKGSDEVMSNIDNPFVLAVAKPSADKNILLLDYEKIVLELAPSIARREKLSMEKTEWKGKDQLILIAEDSAPVRDMLEVELGELNFRVITTRDGEEAVNVFKENSDIALVIADVEMPKKDGLAVLGEIRQHTERQNTPVLIYSSIGDIGMKERAKVMEANAHITKLELQTLLANVKDVLK